MMSRALVFLKLARAQYLPVVVIPVFAGGFLAGKYHVLFDWRFFVCLLGAAFAHLGANTANDYFDWIKGTDKICWNSKPELKDQPVCGSKVIPLGLVSERQALFLSLAFFAGAFLCGLVLSVYGGWKVMTFGLAGFLLGFFYCAPPVSFGYIGRGLGELAVFLCFGVLPVVGTYYVLAGFDTRAVVGSVPFGLIGANVLYHHHFSHIDVDRASRKISPPVLLGRSAAKILGRILIAAIALSILACVYFGVYPKTALVSLLPLILLVTMPWKDDIKSDLKRMKLASGISLLAGALICICLILG